MVDPEFWKSLPLVIAASGTCFASIGGFIASLHNGTKLAKVEATGNATHALSNSAMGVQLLKAVQLLKVLSVQAHRMAELTKADGDISAAAAVDVQVAAAEADYQKHVTQQAVVDAQTVKNAQ